MTVGERIKRKREESGLSVIELAAKLGKARSTVYRYESDEIEDMPITVLEPLAIALNTTPAYLMGWTNDMLCLDGENKIESRTPDDHGAGIYDNTSISYVDFQRNLQMYMDMRGIDQAEIAAKLNVTALSVAEWVNGEKYPRVEDMQRLADLLSASISDLTAREGKRYGSTYVIDLDEQTYSMLEEYRDAHKLDSVSDAASRLIEEVLAGAHDGVRPDPNGEPKDDAPPPDQLTGNEIAKLRHMLDADYERQVLGKRKKKA